MLNNNKAIKNIYIFDSKTELSYITAARIVWLSLILAKPIAPRCCFSIPPENIRKPVGRMFSGGIEKQHRGVMG